MSIPAVDIDKLAALARLDLTPEESAELGPEMASILAFVRKLGELDTEGVEPMTTALDIDNRFRDDRPAPSLPRELALQNAPQTDGEHFLVPPVL